MEIRWSSGRSSGHPEVNLAIYKVFGGVSQILHIPAINQGRSNLSSAPLSLEAR